MKFEDAKQEMPQDRSVHGTEGIEKEIQQEAENFLRPRIRELLERAKEEPDKKRFMLDHIASYEKSFFQGKKYILNDTLTKIDVLHYDTDRELEENIVGLLAHAIGELARDSDFSLDKARQYFQGAMRNAVLENLDFIPLDKEGILSYSRFNDTIDLHITAGLTRRTLQDAIASLAAVLQKDESIKKIEMASPVVAEHPDIIKRYGFTLDDALDAEEETEIRAHLPIEIRDKPLAKAHMDRKEFLQRYGAKQ